MADKFGGLAEQAILGLKELADPVCAEGERRYFKETINPLGVTSPKVQALEKQLCKGIEKAGECR